MPEKKMTCVEAVRILLSRWKVGEMKTGGKIEREVNMILRLADSDEFPSGHTIGRRFREQKGFDIVSNMHGKDSKYVRLEQNDRVKMTSKGVGANG